MLGTLLELEIQRWEWDSKIGSTSYMELRAYSEIHCFKEKRGRKIYSKARQKPFVHILQLYI